MAYYKKIKSRKSRGKAIRSSAKTTKGGKGPISKRPAYKKAMKKTKKRKSKR